MMKYLKVWTDFQTSLSPFKDDEIGRLFLAMLHYADTGEEPAEFAGNEAYLWPTAKLNVDRTRDENEKRKKSGSEGGLAKASKSKQITASASKPNQTEANDSQKEKKRNEKKGNEKKEIMFDRFWIAYPRHEAKQNARKAFDKLNPDEELLAKMLWAIGKQKNSAQWQEEGGRFIPHPASWLNQRRWEDEPAKPVVKVAVQSYEQRDYSNEQEEAMLRMIKGAGA